MSKNVIVKAAGKKGKGVFALKDFQKDELILYITGEVAEINNPHSLSKYDLDHCFPFDREGKLYKYVLPNDPWQYLNHSCNPNAGIKNNRDLVAMKPIKKGEEICFDYSMNNIDDWTMKCHCGSKNCRKIISTFASLDEETKKKYFPYVLDCIKKSI